VDPVRDLSKEEGKGTMALFAFADEGEKGEGRRFFLSNGSLWKKPGERAAWLFSSSERKKEMQSSSISQHWEKGKRRRLSLMWSLLPKRRTDEEYILWLEGMSKKKDGPHCLFVRSVERQERNTGRPTIFSRRRKRGKVEVRVINVPFSFYRGA